MGPQSQSMIYAELLANIGRISLAVSLSSPCDASTRIAVTADGNDVELRHQAEVHKLRLPGKVALGGAVLPIHKLGVTALSWRLPLETSSSPLQQRGRDATESQAAPWSAIDLEAGSEISCRQCGTVIVNRDVIKVWKDLPSENWAEMMEFWHCHKPEDADDENHSHGHGTHHRSETNGGKADEQSLASRGYGASSTISAQESVGFVDLTTLLFAESDCASVMFSLSTPEQGSPSRQSLLEAHNQTRNLNVFCSSCHTQLGFFNHRTAAATLSKWQVSCKSASGASPGISECLAATLVSTISRSASSKSLITPITDGQADPSAGTTVIHIWVLNSNMVYSSTAAEHSTQAIKLFYRLISRDEADRMLETVTCDAQEISLPANALGEATRLLEKSNLLLPDGERLFEEWKVGLLTK
ncbi:ubiquitin-conjugating enzyme E2-binding protein [Bombardia bombarda]|uniref:Ubiquitin-conjugating enzyme E2-binding protein n=1 Tax=Bombardia bombarda TaxID=252184 RepID=A0AA39TUN8_9PEZI|nr:ubiquitin-conjugating enzyme E2-binding protein [Bombardia bombarda]